MPAGRASLRRRPVVLYPIPAQKPHELLIAEQSLASYTSDYENTPFANSDNFVLWHIGSVGDDQSPHR
jgi:hypothetical protein